MPCCLGDDLVKEVETLKRPPRTLSHLDTSSEVHISIAPSCDTPVPVPLDHKKANPGNKKNVSNKRNEKRVLKDREHKTEQERTTKKSQVSTPDKPVDVTAKEAVTKVPTSEPLNTYEVLASGERMSPLGQPSLQTSGARSPLGQPSLQTSGTRTALGQPSLQTSGTRTPLGQPSLQTSGARSPLGQPSLQTIANGIDTPNPALLCLLLLKLLSGVKSDTPNTVNTRDISPNTDTVVPGEPPNSAPLTTTVTAKPSITDKRATAESRSIPSLLPNSAGAAKLNTNKVVCVPPSATRDVAVKDEKKATPATSSRGNGNRSPLEISGLKDGNCEDRPLSSKN